MNLADPKLEAAYVWIKANLEPMPLPPPTNDITWQAPAARTFRQYLNQAAPGMSVNKRSFLSILQLAFGEHITIKGFPDATLKGKFVPGNAIFWGVRRKNPEIGTEIHENGQKA